MALGSKFATIAPVFTFTPTGSTVVTDLAPWTKDFKLSQPVDSAESTGYGNTSKTYVKTIQDVSCSWVTFLEPTGGIEDILLPGAAGTIIFGPSGSTAGNRKYTITGFISDFSANFAFSDVAQADTAFMPSSVLSRAVYP